MDLSEYDDSLLCLTPDCLQDTHFRQAVDWLRNDSIRRLADRYAECVRKRDVNIGFNLFHLISEVYHRENLHSDIMHALLDPSGKHGEGSLFLRLFLKHLGDHQHVNLCLADYSQATVTREDARIDLLIRDNESKKAIIIENKINGAHDMDRQVVRYLEIVEDSWGFQCDAIVYLCLNRKTLPDRSGWKEVEKSRVTPLLRVVCAYDESEDDLFNGWLLDCLDSSQNDEVKHVIRQYRDSILKIGRNLMNQPVMDEFYQMINQRDHYDAAISLAPMIADLPSYRCQKLVETFQIESPFNKVWYYNSCMAVFDGLRDRRIKIHMTTSSADNTTVQFWNNEDSDPEGELPRQILQDIGMNDSFSFDDGWFTKEFKFPDKEEDLYSFLGEFLSKLSTHPISSH